MFVTDKKEIPEAEYFTYQHLPKSKLHEIGEKFQQESGYACNAYGHYGTWLLEDDGKYYICWERGDSCD